jgi:hypothetical protein
MYRILIFSLLLIGANSLQAQNYEPLTESEESFQERVEKRTSHNSDMKTLFDGSSHSGSYFAFNFKGHNYFDEDVLIFGVKTVGVINRSLGIGFEGNIMLRSIEISDIDLKYLPEGGSMRPLIGFGGLLLEYILFSNQPVHVTFPILIGAGWAAYVRDWNEKVEDNEKELLDDAVFFLIEPGINLEFNLTRNTRFGLGASYRSTSNFDLESTGSKSFNGLNLNMMLKFGRF